VHVRTPTIEDIPHDEVTVATYRQAELGPISFGNVILRDELRLECDDIGTGFYIQIPTSGRYESRHRGCDVEVSRLSAAVYRPGAPFAGRWPGRFAALCVRIDVAAVDNALAGAFGERRSSRVRFAPLVSTVKGYGRAWAGLLFSIDRQLSGPETLLLSPLVAAPLADSLVNGFLLAAVHAFPDAVAASVSPARPASVRAAVDLIEADPAAALTVTDLAASCDVSARALQKAFQQHLGMSPMQYLREVRLRRAHEDLRSGDPAALTVADVARRWGFGHLGRFAAAHEAKFGQKPLHTLRG
jgi:AraC-like DNA-binding protein